MSTIDHDQNGPFVRAYNATTAPQTATVYALEVAHEGEREYWDVSATPFTDERLESTRRLAYRHKRGSEVRYVARTITISASEWQEVAQA